MGIQANVNHSGNTFFDVSGGINQVCRVLVAYLDSMGQFADHDEEYEVTKEINEICISVALTGNPEFIKVNEFLINIDR